MIYNQARIGMTFKQIVLVTLLTASSLVSYATDFFTTTTILNVRCGDGIGFPVAFTLNKGDEVEILSRDGEWCKIKFFGKTGYVASKFLTYSRSVSGIESVTPKPNRPILLIGLIACLGVIVAFHLLKKARDKKLLERVTDSNRGEWSERELVLSLSKFGIPANALFHDLYLEKRNGKFSQIDLVAVTEVGILVFEVKDYSGWIFGSGHQLKWTKVLAYGKQKYRFYNPILQNKGHVDDLKKHLSQFGTIPFYSIVVFYGDCVLKEIEFIPDRTFVVKSERVLEVVKLILEQNVRVHYTTEEEILQVLKQAAIKGGIEENRVQHNQNIDEMLGRRRLFN
jgi:uncharacterized protein YraI